jgi:hypothetical protein
MLAETVGHAGTRNGHVAKSVYGAGRFAQPAEAPEFATAEIKRRTCFRP